MPSTSYAAVLICENRSTASGAIIEEKLHMGKDDNALFLFCGRRHDSIKAILYEKDGIVLLYKRLSVDGRFRWPKDQTEVRQLTWQQFDWLMSGLEIEQPKAFKPLPAGGKVLSLLPGMDLKCFKISLFSALFPWSYLLAYDIIGPV